MKRKKQYVSFFYERTGTSDLPLWHPDDANHIAALKGLTAEESPDRGVDIRLWHPDADHIAELKGLTAEESPDRGVEIRLGDQTIAQFKGANVLPAPSDPAKPLAGERTLAAIGLLFPSSNRERDIGEWIDHIALEHETGGDTRRVLRSILLRSLIPMLIEIHVIARLQRLTRRVR
jgi:hypothetical protein